MARQSAPIFPTGLAKKMVWVFARFDGRIGRHVYWLASAFLIAVTAMFVRPEIDPETGAISLQISSIGFVFVFATMVANIAVAAKRLHDFNASAFFTIALLVPALSLLAILIIGLVPGTPAPNRFGPAPDVLPRKT